MTFQQQHWYLKDLQYTYLDDGFTLIATTDVPCHLFCRMTSTPPRKHALPSYRRGLYLQGDIRFCFVVYEDNEQAEAGDTLTHTFAKSAWPVCERRWFHFIGNINGVGSPSESPIFEFHFPAPPPEPPPPMERWFASHNSDRTLYRSWGTWPWVHDHPTGNIHIRYGLPPYLLFSGNRLTAAYDIWRAFLRFDTTPLPATALIQSAEIQVFVYRTYCWGGPPLKAIIITPGFQHNPIVTTDYGDQLPYTTEFGRRDIDTMATGFYNNLNLNELGRSFISPSGITKFCLRGEHDVLDFAPIASEKFFSYHSYQKGEDHRAYLHVSYYPA